MNKHAKIFVAGHRGMVGSAIVRELAHQGFDNLVLRTRHELDLTEQLAVREFFAKERPEVVIDAAAKVGGIHANNTYPAEFIAENLQMQTHLISEAHRQGAQKFVFLGSSCIYPKHASQPIAEESLLTGPLEPTNEAYAVAKIAGIKMCQAFRIQYGFDAISLMPTNLYGPGDNFHPENSHVLPALIRRFHEAKTSGAASVSVWGSGTPRREFLYVEDLAGATVHLLIHYSGSDIVNVGVGSDVSIAELAGLVKDVVGFEGAIEFDSSKPDGTPRKLLDVSRINGLGWQASKSLRDGLEVTYDWYCEHLGDVRAA